MYKIQEMRTVPCRRAEYRAIVFWALALVDAWFKMNKKSRGLARTT